MKIFNQKNAALSRNNLLLPETVTTKQGAMLPTSIKPQRDAMKVAFMLILVVQCLLGLWYILKVPLWMPSDERAHMRYIMDLASTGHLHVMRVGDPSYETHQPPLFYTLAAGLYLLLKPFSLSAAGIGLRVFCFVFHVSTTVFVAGIFRRHLAAHPLLILAAVTFFALNASLLAINATISNDSLCFFLVVWVAWLLSNHDFRVPDSKHALSLGIVAGLGMLCKLTAAPVLLVVLLCLFCNSPERHWKNLLILALFILLPSAILLAPWLGWNHSVYGSWTATSRLYGIGPAYLQHPYPVRSLQDFSFLSLFVYHFLPTEFWLNQFKTASWLKAALLGTTALSLTGLGRLGRQKATLEQKSRNLLKFCAIFYGCFFCGFVMLDIGFSAGPVRWIFGTFFAFSLLWCVGIEMLRGQIFGKQFPGATLGLILFSVGVTNLYSLWHIPQLKDFGLHP